MLSLHRCSCIACNKFGYRKELRDISRVVCYEFTIQSGCGDILSASINYDNFYQDVRFRDPLFSICRHYSMIVSKLPLALLASRFRCIYAFSFLRINRYQTGVFIIDLGLGWAFRIFIYLDTNRITFSDWVGFWAHKFMHSHQILLHPDGIEPDSGHIEYLSNSTVTDIVRHRLIVESNKMCKPLSLDSEQTCQRSDLTNWSL